MTQNYKLLTLQDLRLTGSPTVAIMWPTYTIHLCHFTNDVQ